MNGRTLWRLPEKGKVRGVCAGLAEYFDIPVLLLRVIVVLSLFFGLFAITITLYFVLGFVLDEKPQAVSDQEASTPAPGQLLDELARDMQRDEQRIREMERYVTSETFGVRSRFRQL